MKNTTVKIQGEEQWKMIMENSMLNRDIENIL